MIGFSAAEMDLLIEGMAAEESGDPEDEALPAVEGRAVSQKGDLWLLGPHRLFCGDATDRASFERLMDGAKAEMIFTDPPYNVPIEGHVSGLGEIEHREFAMASGEMHPRGRPRKKPDTHAELLAVLQERGVGDDRR